MGRYCRKSLGKSGRFWKNITRSKCDCNWTRTQNHLVLKRTLNHLAKLAKWLSCVLSTFCTVHLTVCSCHVTYAFQSESTLESSCSHFTFKFPPALSKEFLDIQATIECGFTLKCVRDMTRTYSQMHRTDKYSEHSSIIWPVWPNGWVFV